jgi:hypothetical protein
MNILDRIKILRAVIASLEGSRTASLYQSNCVALKFLRTKLANAWKPNRHLNELAYAQTLDGVSGSGDKYSGNWRKTRRRLEKDIQENPAKYKNFDHEWLNPQAHDIYAPLFKSIQKFTGVAPDDKEDILVLTLSGVSNSGVRGGVGYHRAGEKLRDGILSGKISPATRGSGSSVSGKVVGYAMNAHRDILRKIKRQRGDQDLSNVTVRSKKPQSTDIEVVLQNTPAGAWDFIDFKEEFKRGLGKAEGVEGLLTNLSEGRSATIARKVLEAAAQFWRQDRGLKKVKKKDEHRGRDLMLAYADLLQTGHANPRMDEITAVFRNLPVTDDEVAKMRAATPDRNFHNDIKKAKLIGLASFGKLMQKDKRVIEALAEWAQGNTGRRASINITQRVAVRYARQLLGHNPKTAGQYEPSRLWGTVGSLRLLSAFQVVSGLPVRGVSKKDALKIIGKMTALRIPSNLKAPSGSSKFALKDWLDWLAQWAEKAGQMEWSEPYRWAIPAAADRGWFKAARHPKGPMSKEDKEKLMEENPKFKEMNEEHGDKFKKTAGHGDGPLRTEITYAVREWLSMFGENAMSHGDRWAPPLEFERSELEGLHTTLWVYGPEGYGSRAPDAKRGGIVVQVSPQKLTAEIEFSWGGKHTNTRLSVGEMDSLHFCKKMVKEYLKWWEKQSP